MADPTDSEVGASGADDRPPGGVSPPPSYPTPGRQPPTSPPPGYPQGDQGLNYPPPGFPPSGAPYTRPYGGGPTGPTGPAVPREVYAGYWPRVGGWIIDAVIVWVVSYLLSIPIRHSSVASVTIHTTTNGVTRTGQFSGLELIVEVVVVLLYGALFCGSARGQTPGMMAVGVRAVDRDTGGPVGFARAFGRGAFEYLLFIVLIVPWILDMLFPLWDVRRQTLHDKVSKTVVVRAALFPPGARR